MMNARIATAEDLALSMFQTTLSTGETVPVFFGELENDVFAIGHIPLDGTGRTGEENTETRQIHEFFEQATRLTEDMYAGFPEIPGMLSRPVAALDEADVTSMWALPMVHHGDSKITLHFYDPSTRAHVNESTPGRLAVTTIPVKSV